jgi:hypothetical protein
MDSILRNSPPLRTLFSNVPLQQQGISLLQRVEKWIPLEDFIRENIHGCPLGVIVSHSSYVQFCPSGNTGDTAKLDDQETSIIYA